MVAIQELIILLFSKITSWLVYSIIYYRRTTVILLIIVGIIDSSKSREAITNIIIYSVELVSLIFILLIQFIQVIRFILLDTRVTSFVHWIVVRSFSCCCDSLISWLSRHISSIRNKINIINNTLYRLKEYIYNSVYAYYQSLDLIDHILLFIIVFLLLVDFIVNFYLFIYGNSLSQDVKFRSFARSNETNGTRA